LASSGLTFIRCKTAAPEKAGAAREDGPQPSWEMPLQGSQNRNDRLSKKSRRFEHEKTKSRRKGSPGVINADANAGL
jgi:hypothetical protein